MSVLLKEFVRRFVEQQLNEAFRGFKFNKFKQIIDRDHRQGFEYAKKHLPFLGRGTARASFGLGSGKTKVLKIARPDSTIGMEDKKNAGVFQNTLEIKAFKKMGKTGLVAKIYDHDQDVEPVWILAEPVQVIKTSQDSEISSRFNTASKTMFGLPDTFYRYLAYEAEHSDDGFGEILEAGLEEVGALEEEMTKHDLELAQKIFILVREYGIYDIGRLDHWGVSTEDGRLVVIDYGISDI